MHSLVERDCRDLSFVPSESVHLVITHPPAFRASREPHALGQLSAISDYDHYLAQLDFVWAECERVLVPGGHLACVASPVAASAHDLPVAADVHARARSLGLAACRAIRWILSDQVGLDEDRFFGQANQPCGELISECQDILVLRKPGKREVSVETEVSSRMRAEFFAMCSSSVWLIPAQLDPRHPEVFPFEVAERLVRMFSFAGDTVLDPFAGLGTTSAAAIACGRNSIAVEIEPRYFETMSDRLASTEWPGGEITVTRGGAAPSRALPVPVV